MGKKESVLVDASEKDLKPILEFQPNRLDFLVHHKPLYDYHLDFTNGWKNQEQ